MTRKHHAIYSDPTGAAAGAAPAKRRTTRTKGSESSTSEISSKAAKPTLAVDRGAVARLAYSYWEARGFAGGSAEEDWLRAEQEIRTGQATIA
jgi:hypothetical protein